MNVSRRYSISVCFVYGLKEKDSKSEVIFAVCRLPLTSCLASLLTLQVLASSCLPQQIINFPRFDQTAKEFTSIT